MSVAALYDIHANLPALEAVLEEIKHENVEQLVVGGDVLPGPMPVETIDRLLRVDIPVRFIQGNGEVAVLDERVGRPAAVPERFREAVQWVARQLRPEQVRMLAEWPKTISAEVIGLGRVFFCHATPRSQDEVFTRQTSESKLGPVFARLPASIVICGHTHMQFDRRVGTLRVVNAGSVGSPYAEPGAYWLFLGPDVQLRRTQYDQRKAETRIRATEYPLAAEFVRDSLINPPSEEQMVRLFSDSEPG